MWQLQSSERMLVVCALVILLASCCASRSIEKLEFKPPKFPDVFKMSYTFSLPYLKTVQSQGLSYPIDVWYDNVSGKKRIDVYGGLDSVIYTPDASYVIYPMGDVAVCEVQTLGSSTPEWLQAKLLQGPLPNLHNWQFGGTTTLNGRVATIWRHELREDEKTSTYVLYAAEDDGTPLRFQQLGFEYFKDSHFDEYIYDFDSFVVGPLNDDVFNPPEVCNKPVHHLPSLHAAVARHLAMLPSGTHEVSSAGLDPLYSAWAKKEGRVHSSLEELEQRSLNFRASARLVQETNAKGLGYTLGLNRFADWSSEEFVAVMLPNHARKQAEKQGLLEAPKKRSQPVAAFESRLEKHKLPKRVDWRGTGADTIVKDQAACGSCWAFGTTAALEGAWYLASGEALLLSEQQLVDCAWGEGALGCDGGSYQDGIDWVVESGGGIASEEHYPYMGEDGFCRSNVTQSAFFRGYLQIPPREHAVMEAVYRYGPLGVSVDASADSFRLYQSGVYHNPDCMTDSRDLDHAVVLSGYGTTSDGVDYWLVKNTWSKFFGEDGYIRITRNSNDCGISADVVAAVVREEHVTDPNVWSRVIDQVTREPNAVGDKPPAEVASV